VLCEELREDFQVHCTRGTYRFLSSVYFFLSVAHFDALTLQPQHKYTLIYDLFFFFTAVQLRISVSCDVMLCHWVPDVSKVSVAFISKGQV
jgi:hypothetical protein